MPPSIHSQSFPSWTYSASPKSQSPSKNLSSVEVWLEGLTNQSSTPDDATTTRLIHARGPLRSTQPRSTAILHRIPKSASTQKRKRDMDEDDGNIHGSEPRRSGRIKLTRQTERPSQHDDRSQNLPQTKPKQRGGTPQKTASRTTSRDKLDDAKEMEGDDLQVFLHLRNERVVVGNTATPGFPPPLSPTRTATTRTSSSSSPSRVKGIKRENLVNLNPTIKFETVAEAKKHWPPHIQDLWRDRISALVHETKVVPPQLQSRMRQLLDTPAKSRPPPDDNSLAPANLYPTDDLAFIWTTLCRVIKKTSAQRTRNGPESQWCSFIVAPILDLLQELHRDAEGESQLECLDVSTTSIDPISLCPYHENPEVWRILNKTVDFAIGLAIPDGQKCALRNGTYSHAHAQKLGTSINQTSSWVNHTPMFMNIKVKKKNISEDPMVQIGAWVAAEFKKRELEGYDVGMPVFAIEVEEDMWNLYIIYASGSTSNDLVCLGPESIGDTRSHQGLFKLLYVLNGLAEWGNTDYRAWFEQEILMKCQRR